MTDEIFHPLSSIRLVAHWPAMIRSNLKPDAHSFTNDIPGMDRSPAGRVAPTTD